MRDALDDLIEAYEQLLPRIIKDYGHGWVVFADRNHISRFGAFTEAAKYAQEHHKKQRVLIRHTDEGALTAPYVHIEG